MSANPQPYLEELIAWATPAERKDDLLAARADHFDKTGQVFEDDRQLELRMAGFLEHYVCDRVAPWLSRTPARARYEASLKTETPERAAAFRCWTETNHGLFEVRRLSKGEVRLRGLFSGVDHDVTERRLLAGLTVGDVLEVRLVPFAGHLHLSPAYVWHPHQAAALICAEAKRQLKLPSPPPLEALTWDCAQRALKVERYRQIAVEKIYAFDSKSV